MRLPPDTTDRCTFCDSVATAVWGSNAEPILFVCESCAVEVLPALIADAIPITASTTIEALRGTGAEIDRRFWLALVERMRRELAQ